MNTPPVNKRRTLVAETPLLVPPSPCLKSLGFGTGVSVVELLRAGKSPWAVKRVRHEKLKSDVDKRLQDEAAVLKLMKHPNIVGFRKFQQLRDGRLGLAMESCGVSLGDRIEERREQGLDSYTPSNILKVISDIGKALDYIHTDVKILHGDVKSFNILINGDFDVCKLCDFGVYLPLDENGVVDSTKTNDGYIGTQCWSAPEVLSEEGPLTSKADIFSFGLTIWEMLALEAPHLPQFDENSTFDDSMQDSILYEDDTSNYGTRPAIPEHIDEVKYKDILSLFYCMTVENPANRPSANQIILCIKDIKN